MSKKFSATVAGATIFLILISIFSKGIGFIREILFASRFGTTESYDLYLIAAVFPIVINTSLYYIGQNYFIPLYNKAIVAGEDKGAFVGKNFWMFVIGGTLLSAVLILVSDPLLNFYVGSSYIKNKELIKNIFNIITLSIPLGSGVAVLSSFINAEFEFRIPAYSNLILNIIIVIAVFVFSGKILIYSIPAGYLAGTILQLIFLLIYVKYVKNIRLKFKQNISIRMRPDKIIISIILIEVLGQLYLLIDRWFYPAVDAGGMSALSYAGNLFSLPISLVSVSFAAVLFPFLSKEISLKNEENYSLKIIESLKISSLIFIPVFVVLFFYGEIIIQLIYERGKFSHPDTIMTSDVLKVMSLGLIFFSGYSILNKSLFAAQKIKYLLIITIAAVILKVILSSVFIEYFRQNGLALSTAIVYFFFFSASIVVVLKSVKKVLTVFLHLIFYMVLSVLLIYILKIISPLFYPDSVLKDILSVFVYFILYLMSAVILDGEYIRKMNPLTRNKHVIPINVE
ncbi:MAG: polysaccharide biosynthesis protein [Ignavibacteriales bacterium]|nr:MAG: polysaccharide biosynthesis protein [Ignavibacteriales bacterium]